MPHLDNNLPTNRYNAFSSPLAGFVSGTLIGATAATIIAMSAPDNISSENRYKRTTTCQHTIDAGMFFGVLVGIMGLGVKTYYTNQTQKESTLAIFTQTFMLWGIFNAIASTYVLHENDKENSQAPAPLCF